MYISAVASQSVIPLIEEQYPHFDIRSVKGHPSHDSILEGTDTYTKQKITLSIEQENGDFFLYQVKGNNTEKIGRLYGKKEWDERNKR